MKTDLAGVVRRHVRGLFRHLPQARRGVPHAVHQARVASRRLREVLPVAAAAVPGPRSTLDRDVRRVTGALGAVREMDVALLEFDDMSARAWSPALVPRMRQHLVEERGRREREMQAKLNRLNLKRLADRLKGFAADAEAGPARAFLGARLRKRAKRFAVALHSAGTLYASGPIHQVRIAGKKLRYTLELARAAANAPVGRDIITLKHLQDLLGRLRDLQVLQEHIRLVEAESAGDVQGRAGLEGMHRDLETECRALHGQFLGRIGRLSALADRVAREVSTGLTVRKTARIAKLRTVSVRRPDGAATA